MQSRLISFVIIVILAIPVFFFLKILERRKRARMLKKGGVHVNAVITQITTYNSSTGRTMDHLLMEYQDRSTGQPFSTQLTVKHGKYQTGDNFPIIYNPSNPAMFVPDEKNADTFYLILIALIFASLVFVLFIVRENMRKKNEEPILPVNGTPKL